MQSSGSAGHCALEYCLPVVRGVLDQLGERLLQDRVSNLRFRVQPEASCDDPHRKSSDERDELIDRHSLHVSMTVRFLGDHFIPF